MKTLKARPIVVIDEPPKNSLSFDPRKVVIAFVAIFVAATMIFAGIGGAYVFWAKDKAKTAKVGVPTKADAQNKNFDAVEKNGGFIDPAWEERNRAEREHREFEKALPGLRGNGGGPWDTFREDDQYRPGSTMWRR